MKKNLFYLFALICSVSLFTACSDDDAPDYTQAIENEIAGGYKGTLDVVLDQLPLATDAPQKVTVEKAGPTAINLSLKNFELIIPVGDVMLHNCTLTQVSGGYAFTGKDVLSVNADGLSLECDIDVKGTVSGNNLSVVLDIAANLGGQNQQVKVTYDGVKLNGNESTAAELISFTIDDERISVAPEIDQENGIISFVVDKDVTDFKFAPEITVSDGATVTPASGVEQDFSNEVKYTVVSEDYSTVKVYTVKRPFLGALFDFDQWNEAGTMPMPTDVWASGAAAASILGGKDLLVKEDRGDGTFAAKMKTFEYAGEANSLFPKITAGSLFSGKFDMMPALSGKRLECTKFGVAAEKMISGKPVTFKGWYKYQSGEKFLDASEDIQGVVVPDKKDECAIQAVLYKAVDAEGNDVQLTGVDINTSEHIVAYAFLADGTEKAEFTSFTIPFTYKEDYDAEVAYKLAIVCTSSKEGDHFKGAGESTLWVDNFEIICE